MGTLADTAAQNVDVDDLRAVTEVEAAYLTRDFPAWTSHCATALAFPGQLLEIEATALARAG